MRSEKQVHCEKIEWKNDSLMSFFAWLGPLILSDPFFDHAGNASWILLDLRSQFQKLADPVVF